MKIKSTVTMAAMVLVASFFGNAAVASPIAPTHSIAVEQKLTQSIHYRGYRHCHHRNGRRRCHGGNAYYGGPSIYLGFGGGRHQYRGHRGGGRHMHHTGRH